MTPNVRVQRNEPKPRVVFLWLRGRWQQSGYPPVESVEYRLHGALREINLHCSRRLPLRKAAPCLESSLAAEAEMFDRSDRAAYCIPSTPGFADSGTGRQSIHAREDAHPDARDYADLLR